MKNFTYKRIDQSEITAEQFNQVLDVESTSDSGYEEEIMREMWLKKGKNDNFVCLDDSKIIAHATFNPHSKRRNGSIFGSLP